MLADALSWYAPKDADEILLNISINYLGITPQHKSVWQLAVSEDPQICTLADMIIDGWLDGVITVPYPLCLFWSSHSILTIEDGIIHTLRRGHPHFTWRERKCAAHKAWRSPCIHHVPALCIQLIYWQGINADIKRIVKACETYQHYRPHWPHQPLGPSPAPECPWQ